MKTTITLAVLAALLIHFQNTAAQAIDIGEALRKGMLTISATAEGGHSGECLSIKLHNKSRKNLEIRIPAGQVFIAGDSSLQDLMAGKEELLVVETGKARIAKLFGFCIEAYDGSPGKDAVYKLGALASGPLLKLAQHLSQNNLYKNPYAQYAVWAVTDGERLEGVGDPGLAEFVAGLLGKPLPAYHIQYQQPQDRLLPGQPANLREAAAMNGLFYYDLPKDQTVTFGLYAENGELAHTLFSNRLQKRGHHKFRFEFEIRNLPKGKYFARLVSEGRTVKELAVEF